MTGHFTMSTDDVPDEVLDDEWEDFQRLMTQYKLRHKHHSNQTSMLDWKEKPKARTQTAFYPCPPPVEDDKDMEMEAMDSPMYGRFTRDLGEFAKEEARRVKKEEKIRRKNDRERNEELYKYRGACATKLLAVFRFVWGHTFAKLGEDWVFLTLLGLIMACLSYFMDTGIGLCNKGRLWLYRDLATHPALQYFAWVSLPLCLILFAAGFVHLVAPQSIGSGIPEMKTILRGVALKEYLTFRTLVAKVIGLTSTLGSGMPVGKEGPFVHIACTVATTLSKLVTSFQGIYQNESRNTEMLAAACAVGVASCFASPIGGVLFSIEVTTVYFAVRNYWRGFFGSVCAATSFRLLAVWFQKEDTVVAVFGTNFTHDFPFDPQELAVFAAMGVVCGFGGALYVWTHRQYVLFMRKNKKVNMFLQKNRFLYPGIITLLTLSICFPLGLGRYMAGDLNTHDQVASLFSNFTWTKDEFTVQEAEVMSHWSTSHSSVFVSLTGFVLFNYIFSIVASTIPVPAGSFIPVFKIGAGIGRIFGEVMHILFPLGVRYSGIITPIIPGGYATVGAAAFSGAVTHTVSTSVIVVEMTGQITHIIPIMIAVLIANATAVLLQPSIYDSIILIKKLPYLPDLLPSGSGMYSIYVEDFMFREVRYIWNGMTYHDLKRVLQENRDLRGFPLVDNPDSMILLGSMQRMELIRLIEKHVGRERRLEVAALLQKEAQQRALEEFEKRVQEEVERRQRRPSRFEVTPALELFQLRQQLSNADLQQPRYHHPVFGVQPKKSILKKTGSFNLQQYGMMTPTHGTPYTTITGAESRIKLAFDNIFKKSTKLQDVTPNTEMLADTVQLTPAKEPVQVVGSESGTNTPLSTQSHHLKKVQLPRERVIDMSPEDQKAWEDAEMTSPVKFEDSHIDPAPFQLVERTSLLKVHSIFSMVGVNHAYVTAIGRLVGVVGLKELRKVIEDVNSGTFSSQNAKTENTANVGEDAGPSEPLVDEKKPAS